MDDIRKRWEKIADDEFLEFDRVSPKRSSRPDIHAFILLNEIFPGDSDIIAAAEHDEIYLDVYEDKIKQLTDAQIVELSRCGVRYGEYGLAMFV